MLTEFQTVRTDECVDCIVNRGRCWIHQIEAILMKANEWRRKHGYPDLILAEKK